MLTGGNWHSGYPQWWWKDDVNGLFWINSLSQRSENWDKLCQWHIWWICSRRAVSAPTYKPAGGCRISTVCSLHSMSCICLFFDCRVNLYIFGKCPVFPVFLQTCRIIVAHYWNVS